MAFESVFKLLKLWCHWQEPETSTGGGLTYYETLISHYRNNKNMIFVDR